MVYRFHLAAELCKALMDEFSIDAYDEILNLPRIYDAAKRKDSAGVQQFLLDWFTGCTPSWQDILVDFQWRRIWTLNIDDVIENVYKGRGINVARFDWTSNHRDTRDSTFQVIHLHGFLDSEPEEAHKEQSLIFSFSEYASTLVDPRAWHAVFNSEFTDLPVYHCGGLAGRRDRPHTST